MSVPWLVALALLGAVLAALVGRWLLRDRAARHDLAAREAEAREQESDWSWDEAGPRGPR